MIVKRFEKCDVTSSNSIASVRGVAHFRPTTFGIFGKPLDHAERQILARPEGVVDDDADFGFGFRGGADILLEVPFRVREIEGAGHLDEFGPELLRRPGELCKLERAGRLRAHGDGNAPATSSMTMPATRAALVEGHRRKVAGRAAGKEGGIVGVEAAVDQEADIGPQRRLIDRKPRLVRERRRDRYVAPLKE